MNILSPIGSFLLEVIVGPKDPARAGTAAVKRVIFGLLLLGLTGGAAHYVGLSQGQGDLARQSADYEARLEQAQTAVQQVEQRIQTEVQQAQQRALADVQQAQAQATAAESINALLQTRIALYRAAVELDRRNFGTANDFMKEAAQSLQAVNATAARLDGAQVNLLRQAIEATNIAVARDIEAQRAQVIQLAQQMDALLPR